VAHLVVLGIIDTKFEFMNEKETAEELNKRAAELEETIAKISATAKALRQQAEKTCRDDKNISGHVQDQGVKEATNPRTQPPITGASLILKQQQDEEKRRAEKIKGWT
jgi:hypothetical protein